MTVGLGNGLAGRETVDLGYSARVSGLTPELVEME